MRLLVVLILGACAAGAHAAAPAPPPSPPRPARPARPALLATAPVGDVIVNTFEDDVTARDAGALRAANAAIVESSDGAAEGKSYIQLVPTKPDANLAQLRMSLPAGSTPAGREMLAAAVRAPGATQKMELRWYALDAKNRPLFQRRFDLEPGEQWVRLDEPLRTWRWDNRRVGDWDEVTSIALVVASPNVKRIDLDDVRFTGVADEKRNVEWLLDLAFAERPRETAQGDGLLVATDAIDAFAPADLNRLLDQMRRTRTWLRNIFGDVDRPTDDHHAPAALLIFKQPADYPDFFKRLGAAWRVEIGAPLHGGYTVQDIASSTYDPKLGPRRPVYFHEAVHAVVSRELHLLAGSEAHRGLQEGIANYLQVGLYPTSLPRSAYVKQFAQPVDPSGGGFFKPLEMLFSKPVTTKEYAQAASVVAFLVEKDPKLLRELARGLADGESATQVLTRGGTSWQQVQNAWFAWGQERFRADGAADGPAFAPPAEFR